MADDSELDYLKTFFTYALITAELGSDAVTVNHYSEKKILSQIDDTRRLLIYPPELIGVDGKFYTKRYQLKISDINEAGLTEIINLICNKIEELQRQQNPTVPYTNYSFDCTSEDNDVRGIASDGEYFWVVGYTSNKVYKYTLGGVYTGTDVAIAEDTKPECLCWDGTNFWLLGGNNLEVYKYDTDFVYQTVSFSVSEDVWCTGICWDGTYFYMTGLQNHKIYQYTSAGVYTTENWDMHIAYDPWGLDWDGEHFWLVIDDEGNGDAIDGIYRYTSELVYDDYVILTHPQDAGPRGIHWDGEHFWITGGTIDDVFKYSRELYMKENTLVYIEFKYGNKAYEQPKTKRWSQDIYIDVEWSTA